MLSHIPIRYRRCNIIMLFHIPIMYRRFNIIMPFHIFKLGTEDSFAPAGTSVRGLLVLIALSGPLFLSPRTAHPINNYKRYKMFYLTKITFIADLKTFDNEISFADTHFDILE